MWRVFGGLLIILALVRVVGVHSASKAEINEGNKIKIESEVKTEPKINWNGRKVFQLAGIEIQTVSVEEIREGDRIRAIGIVKSRLIIDKVNKKWLEADQIIILSRNKGFKFGEAMRSRLRENIRKSLPPKESALLVGLVWGDTSQMSYEMRDLFRRTGLSHIVAASGFNVTLIASWLILISARLFPKKWAMVFVIFSIILYMYLAGLSTPIIRAGLMAMCAALVTMFGRQGRGWYILGLVGVGMLIFNPLWASSVSFQLSVMATAAMIYASGGKNLLLIADFKNTLWVYLFTIPILVFHFGNISTWGPVANLLILWLIPLVTQLGLIISLAGIISVQLSQILANLVIIPLRYILGIAEVINKLPFTYIEIGDLSVVAVIIYYFILTSICIKRELYLRH